METEDLVNLNSEVGNVNDHPYQPGSEVIEADSVNSEVKGELIVEDRTTISDGSLENARTLMTTVIEKEVHFLPIGIDMTNSVTEVEIVHESLAVQSECSLSNQKYGTHLSSREVDAISLSGVKRPRIDVDEQQPSVHVIYNSLTKDSKQKLEELLQQWSQWHARSCSSSNDSDVVLESGQETYFPALRIDLDKPCAVTFRMDGQINNESNKELMALDDSSVPFYDRGYSVALTSADGLSSLDRRVETVETSRCFNCGSYSHGLKDCPKPRDDVAVGNARKQHNFKRNKQSSSRNSSRYYQSTPGGKFDGLTPGALDAETRKVLGLRELDPPPWLNRMREIGYPPGYLEPDEEDQRSGITIFGEEAEQIESEDGEILDGNHTNPSRKMSVKFPGINAPIPENADERLWASTTSSLNRSGGSSLPRYRHSSNDFSRWSYYERWQPKDSDDDGPPGCEPRTSHYLSSRRYGDYDSPYSSSSPHDSSYSSPYKSQLRPWSPPFGRSLSDRGRRSPPFRDDSPNRSHYGTFPYSLPR